MVQKLFQTFSGSILNPVLFLVFTGDLPADPAKSNLQLPNPLLNIHSMNAKMQATTTYGKVALT